MGTVAELAAYFQLPAELLGRHVIEPLAEPFNGSRFAWDTHIPASYELLLAICDGVDFFGREPWDRFHLWGSNDFDRNIMDRSFDIGVFPIYGEIPHLASLEVASGSIVATDWEFEGNKAEGWMATIANSFSEYVATTIAIRDSYGYEPGGLPSDWWSPYAAYGSRIDLES